MPPKATISKDRVLETAFAMVRRSGLDGLSARNLAQELGCSTQPIYRTVGSMKVVEETIIERAVALLFTFMLGEQQFDSPFLNMGWGALRFAREEPQLQRLLFLQGKLPFGDTPPVLIKQMSMDPRLSGLDEASLRRIHMKISVFGTGLTTLVTTGALDKTDDEIKQLLLEVGQAVVSWERQATNKQ